MDSNKELVNFIRMKANRYLDNIKRDEKVLEAMLMVDRINFLPSSVKKFAYEDTPLSIGYNQTCSQPSMVAFMLDKLNIKPDTVVTMIENKPIPIDEILSDGQELTIIHVSSGG